MVMTNTPPAPGTGSEMVPFSKRTELSLEIQATKEKIREMIEENYGTDLEPEFTRVKIPTGGAINFQIETAGGIESMPFVEGPILFHHTARAYFPGEFKGDEPPVCSSKDGVTGDKAREQVRLTKSAEGVYGPPVGGGTGHFPAYGQCSSCIWNQWDTGKEGRGKACKEMRRIYILPLGKTKPLLLSLPPTSLKVFSSYVNLISDEGLGLRGVVTRVTLEQDTNESKIKYSKAKFTAVARLNDSSAEQSRTMAKELLPVVHRVRVDQRDYNVKDELPGGGGKRAESRIVVGVVAGDPILRYTRDGAAVTTFSIYADDNEMVSCTAWDDLAELLATKAPKGTRLEVAGTIEERTFSRTDEEEPGVHKTLIVRRWQAAPVQQKAERPAWALEPTPEWLKAALPRMVQVLGVLPLTKYENDPARPGITFHFSALSVKSNDREGVVIAVDQTAEEMAKVSIGDLLDIEGLAVHYPDDKAVAIRALRFAVKPKAPAAPVVVAPSPIRAATPLSPLDMPF